MVVRRVHPSGFDFIGDVGGQFAEAVDATFKRTQALQLGVFVCRHEIAADAAVASDRHRFALRFLFVASKAFSELGGCGRTAGFSPSP